MGQTLTSKLARTYHFMIMKNGTTDFSTAIGTGPYKVKEFNPGVSLVGVRNENYFLSGRPYMDEKEIFGIGDDNARLNALYSGDVHMILSIAMAAVPEVESKKCWSGYNTCSQVHKFDYYV